MNDNGERQAAWVYTVECLHALIAKVLPDGIPTRTRVLEELRELRNGVKAAGTGNDAWPRRLEGEKLMARKTAPDPAVARRWVESVPA